MKLALLAVLNAERAARRACVLVTPTNGGAQRLVREAEIGADPLAPLLAEALRTGRSGPVEVEGRTLFLGVHAPPIRLVATGAVHISQALGPMARLAGLDVTIIDPRTAFATPERFPDVALLAEWPDSALARIGLDRHTAFVALTHDPKIDDPALALALRSDCFHVGALGSRKTHAARVERLRAQGFGPEEVARIKAPIGFNIGAITPAEIAVSILAEIVAARRAERVAARAVA